MKIKTLIKVSLLAITLSTFSCSDDDDNTTNPIPDVQLLAGLTVGEGAIDTELFKRENTIHINESWGKLDLYVNESNTYGTEKMVTGIADILPGQQIHAPYVHEEEEFLYISKGSGIWTVGNEEREAKEGDMLYTQPWKLHGVRNTGTNPLTFHFFKWNNRGVRAPAETDAIDAMGALMTSIIDRESTEYIQEN